MHVTILCGVALPSWDRRRWLERGQQLAANLPGNLGAGLHRRLGVRADPAAAERAQARTGRLPSGAGVAQAADRPVAGGAGSSADRITGFTPSVLRAGAAVCIGGAGGWLMAPADPLTSLAVGGLAMSAFNSYAVCDIGFELSFAAVAGTLAGAELVRRRSARRASRDEEGRPRPLALRLASPPVGRGLGGPAASRSVLRRATFPVLGGARAEHQPLRAFVGGGGALAGPAHDDAGHRGGPDRHGPGAGAGLPGLRLGARLFWSVC